MQRVHLAITWVVAAGAMLLAAILAARYGFRSSDTELDGWLRGAALFIVSIVSTHGLAWAANLWQDRHRLWAVFITLVCFGCLAVALGGGIGTVSGAQAHGTAERAASFQVREGVQKQLKDVENQIRWIPQHRPLASVEAEIAAHKASKLYNLTEGCKGENLLNQSRIAFCKKLRNLEAERESARAASEYDRTRKELLQRLQMMPAAGTADPQAAAIAALTGWSMDFAAAAYALGSTAAVDFAGIAAMVYATLASKKYKQLEAPKPPILIEGKVEPVQEPMVLAEAPKEVLAPEIWLLEALFPGKEVLPLSTLWAAYVDAATAQGKATADAVSFGDQLDVILKDVGVAIRLDAKGEVLFSGVSLRNTSVKLIT